MQEVCSIDCSYHPSERTNIYFNTPNRSKRARGEKKWSKGAPFRARRDLLLVLKSRKRALENE
jgi:hypothetical protein